MVAQLDLMKDNQIDVRIVASDLSEPEALAIELVLIKINNPLFNTDNVHDIDENQIELWVRAI